MPMELIITIRPHDGLPAMATSVCGRFAWNHARPDWLVDTEEQRSVYQMAYMRPTEFGSDPLPSEVAEQVRAFFAALAEHNQAAAQRLESARREALKAADAARLAARYRPEVTGEERQRQARLYDETNNEGGEGFNPWRDL